MGERISLRIYLRGDPVRHLTSVRCHTLPSAAEGRNSTEATHSPSENLFKGCAFARGCTYLGIAGAVVGGLLVVVAIDLRLEQPPCLHHRHPELFANLLQECITKAEILCELIVFPLPNS